MKTIGCLLFLIFTVCGCATMSANDAALNTWVGRDDQSLAAYWGTPHETVTLPSGGKVMEYLESRDVRIGGQSDALPKGDCHSGNPAMYAVPSYTKRFWCKMQFNVNADGTIESWHREGNSCAAYGRRLSTREQIVRIQ